jgi:hypothetical protein
MNIKEYSHIYDKQILYYKHICNPDKNKYKRSIEPYIVYICYLKNGIRNYESFSFLILYNILSIKYNKRSIINHIKTITYGKFNILKLI